MPPSTPPVADLDPVRARSQAAPDTRPGLGRPTTAQPETALFVWVMDTNEGVDQPVPFWPAEVRS